MPRAADRAHPSRGARRTTRESSSTLPRSRGPRRLVLPSLGLLVPVLWALGGCAPAERPSIDRAALAPVPEPALQGLPESGRELLAAERKRFDQRLEDAASIGDLELARAYGELGEHYQAYGLSTAAAVAYDNAVLLGCGTDLEAGEPLPEDRRPSAACVEAAGWLYLGGVLRQEQGDRDGAMRAYRRVLALEPNDRPARLRLVELYLAAGEVDPAEAALAPMVEGAASESAAVLFARGRIASARERHEAAIELYEQALERQPQAKNLHSLLATSYRRVGNRERAEYHGAEIGGGIVTFEDPRMDAVRQRIVGVGPILERALAFQNERKYAESADAYLAALELEPDNTTALRGAASALRKGGDVERAVALLRRFVESHPENRLAELELGTTLIEAAELEEAIDLLESLTRDQPDSQQAFANLGVAYARADRWSEAEAAFGKALELDPFDQVTRFQQALAQKGRGRPEAARATLERIVEETPTFVRARQHLGDLLRERGRPELAAEQFRAVLEIEGVAPQEQALAAYQLGVLATENSRLDAAIDHFESATTLFPELWQAQLALGHRYRDAGRHADAAERYAAAAALQPTLVAAHFEAAASWARAGRFDLALTRLDAARGQLPRAAELANLQARLWATAPNETLRDGPRALGVAADLVRALPQPEHEETLALALAAVGRFDEAVVRQERLLAQVRQQGKVLDARRLEENLERFRNRRLGQAF